MNERPSRDRRGKEEGNFRFAETERGALRRYHPHERDEREERECAERRGGRQPIGGERGLGELHRLQCLGRGDARRAMRTVVAERAEEEEIEISESDDRAHEVFRLAQSSQPGDAPVAERRYPKVNQRLEHQVKAGRLQDTRGRSAALVGSAFRAAGRADEDFLEVHVGFAVAEPRSDIGERAVGNLLAFFQDEHVRAHLLEQVQQV